MSDIVERLYNIHESDLSPLGPALADWIKESVLQTAIEIERLQAELEQANTDNWRITVEKTLEDANLNTALLADNQRLRAELEQERTAHAADLPQRTTATFPRGKH